MFTGMRRGAVYIVALLATVLFVSLLSPAASRAYDPLQDVCSGEKAKESTACKTENTDDPIGGNDGVILMVTRIVAVIAGIVAVIMIIVGGAGMIMSGGDANKVKESRSRIIHALIGLVIIVLAQIIVTLIVQNFIVN